VIIVVVIAGVLALMWRSFRGRVRRDAALPSGYAMPETAADVPGDEAPELASADVLYVATTPRDLPLERLAISGLAFRARATLAVSTGGVLLTPVGERAVFIPVPAIELLAAATWAIDRGVETDGLLLLGWRLDAPSGTPVDSYFRITDPGDRRRITDAIHSIAAGAIRPTTESEA
jgi:hypothetical protein